ncbi:MAG: NAD-dependent epimerase/dehydratase family protein [Phreatobacter sp.]|uniref:NAD-dependent epimerase/dehydratase family protein n=1 Tax=Phreatobacter sp. TaxID=1966341 RepID=UPI002732777A|nr:NAD-dependent epimerase/dehydratase family protein [Phreatobacter sp.]MDP2801989.1 NAD-dependent epimerase/dehydratase family protein [Phreatobacter sp.]
MMVTGAAGLLGNSVLRLAAARGLAVTTWLRGRAGERTLAGLDVPVIFADLANDELEKHVESAGVIVHCAARVGIGRTDAAGFHRDNVLATQRLASACRAVGARLIHVSTVDTLVWGTRDRPGGETPAGPHASDTTYAASKRHAEAAVIAEMGRGLDATIVHPGFLLGPWDWKPSSGRMILAAARGPFTLAPPGGNDFCHAGAVAEALLALADRRPPSDRYVLSGEALTYAEAFGLMRQVAGRPARVIPAPAAAVMAAGYAGDLWGRLSGREPALNSAAAAIACQPHHFSSARAIAEIGYRPRPAIEAMREAWTWFVERGYA